MTVVTVVVFSLMSSEALAPPPSDVISGASLTPVMFTVIVCVSKPPTPSETWTITS